MVEELSLPPLEIQPDNQSLSRLEGCRNRAVGGCTENFGEILLLVGSGIALLAATATLIIELAR
ncbi:hypothetical protein ACFLZ1_02620 [Patescibacteria group bacterium]